VPARGTKMPPTTVKIVPALLAFFPDRRPAAFSPARLANPAALYGRVALLA
jgi:hypothetical protein